MHKSALYLVSCVLGFSATVLPGCASFTSQPEEPEAQEVAVEPVAPQEIRYADFEPEVLYQLLAAEVAAQRGRYDVTLVNYLQAAKTSKDPGVIERAALIAQTLNADNAQQQLADLWLEADPDSLQAHRVAAIQALKRHNLEGALFHMEQIMNQGEDADFDSLAAMSARLSPAQQQELLALYYSLAERHPQTPELEYSIALMLKITNEPRPALDQLNALLEREPNFQPAIILKGDLLYQTGNAKDALNYMTTNTRRFPANRQMGTLYGRMLINEGELQAAQDEFQRLVRRYPETPGLRLSHALVALENQQRDVAKKDLIWLAEQGLHTDEANYYLGRIAEQEEDSFQAIVYYQSVSQGAYLFPAMARASQLQTEQGELDQALANIQQLRENNPDHGERFWLLEINLLLDQDQQQRALEATHSALDAYPGSIEIRYARAMLLDSRGSSEQAIADLRTIIEEDPDNAVALNALGYILTIRTDQLGEARMHIEKALSLDPDNPAILDSMGWVLFRQGDHAGALEYLSQAWAVYPDPEVSAHYGEVLWVTGNKEQARIVWEDALDNDPDHNILTETVERLIHNGESQ